MAEQLRQMKLVEAEHMQHYDVVAPIVIAQSVVSRPDRFDEQHLKEARERIAFYSALSAAEAPKDE